MKTTAERVRRAWKVTTGLASMLRPRELWRTAARGMREAAKLVAMGRAPDAAIAGISASTTEIKRISNLGQVRGNAPKPLNSLSRAARSQG